MKKKIIAIVLTALILSGCAGTRQDVSISSAETQESLSLETPEDSSSSGESTAVSETEEIQPSMDEEEEKDTETTSADVEDTDDDESEEIIPESFAVGEEISIHSEEGDLTLTIDGITRTDWEREDPECDIVSLRCIVDNINFSGLYENEVCGYDLYYFRLVKVMDSNQISIPCADLTGPDDGTYSTGARAAQGEKMKISVPYCVEKTEKALTIEIDGRQLILSLDPEETGEKAAPEENADSNETADAGSADEKTAAVQEQEKEDAGEAAGLTEITETEKYYNDAISLKKSNLTKTQRGYAYNDINLLSEDVAWIDNPLNKRGTVNQGALYRKMATLLEGYGGGLTKYEIAAEHILPEIPETREEFAEYYPDLSTYIVTKDPFVAVMKRFEKLDSVEGSFDYESGPAGAYDITIPDVRECAAELQISEEMLGYILAMLTEYYTVSSFDGPTYTMETIEY